MFSKVHPHHKYTQIFREGLSMQTSQGMEAKQARGIFPLVTGQDLRHTRIRRLAQTLVKYLSEPGFELQMENPPHATNHPAEVPAAQSLRCSNVTSSPVTKLLGGVCQAELRCLLLNFLFFEHPLTRPLSLASTVCVIQSFPLALAGRLGCPLLDPGTLCYLAKFPGRPAEVGMHKTPSIHLAFRNAKF